MNIRLTVSCFLKNTFSLHFNLEMEKSLSEISCVTSNKKN